MSTSAGESFGAAIADLIKLVFTPLFPVALITLCALSYVLTFWFHLPQFLLFAYLAKLAFDYASANWWAILALVVFFVAALLLARVAFREHATQTSRVVGHWIAAGLIGAFMLWMASAWSFDGSGLQLLVFGLVLLCFWVDVCETIMGTIKLIVLARPQPGREVVDAQKAHGHAQLAGEAEARSLLKSKK